MLCHVYVYKQAVQLESGLTQQTFGQNSRFYTLSKNIMYLLLLLCLLRETLPTFNNKINLICNLIFRAIWGFFGGVMFIVIICGYSGLLAYAKYHECDPLDSRLALAKDQLLPLLVMDVLGDWPGMPGIFVAGVFSASLRWVFGKEIRLIWILK